MSTGQADTEWPHSGGEDVFQPGRRLCRTGFFPKGYFMLCSKKLAVMAMAAFVGLQLPAHAEDAVVATVGGAPVHQSELDIAVAGLDPQLAQMPDDQKKIAALSSLIDIKLLAKDAVKDGLDKTEDFKARLQYLTDRELHGAYFRKAIVDTLKPEEVKARYDKEVAALPKEEEVHARHILVKSEDEAKAIIADLDSGKDFIAIAKEKSTDSNKTDGGDLGWFGKGRMVKEFEDAAFALDKGAYSKTPVKSEFGYHIIKVEDKRIAPPPPFEQVEAQVRNLVIRDKYLELLNKAKESSKVEIPDETLRKGYEEATKQ